MNNSRWKGVQGVESLERFLATNPGYYVLDTADRESRYRLVGPKGEHGPTVDGRSVRALFPHRLRRVGNTYILRAEELTHAR